MALGLPGMKSASNRSRATPNFNLLASPHHHDAFASAAMTVATLIAPRLSDLAELRVAPAIAGLARKPAPLRNRKQEVLPCVTLLRSCAFQEAQREGPTGQLSLTREFLASRR